jgi:hypothetical protein
LKRRPWGLLAPSLESPLESAANCLPTIFEVQYRQW